MDNPKLISVVATDQHQLIVTFANQVVKQYDATPLLSKPAFEPLRNLNLFKTARVEQGGYAVVWNEDIDLSEHHLWQLGRVLEGVGA
jgi:Protein of unknown function (DUF2442)